MPHFLNRVTMNTSFVVARRRFGTGALAFLISAIISLTFATSAQAAVVPKVPLATTAYYSVLAGSTVTNTGDSVLDESVGLSPGTSITGFPPGLVNAPGVIRAADATALQAKNDLTTAYVNAQGRSVDATTPADLVGQVLQPGVYSTSGKGALLLNGVLTLDGNGDASSVFIIQTDSTLDTGTGSVVSLINEATACNVFWAIGSSATLGTGSTFVGNILAQESISLSDSVTVNGRALAQTGAVTLINDTFTTPTCDISVAATTTTTTTPVTTTTTKATSPSTSKKSASTSGKASGTSGQTATDLTSITGAPTTGAIPFDRARFSWTMMLFGVVYGALRILGRRITFVK